MKNFLQRCLAVATTVLGLTTGLTSAGATTYGTIFRPRAGTTRFENLGTANAIVPISGGGFYAFGNFTRIDSTSSNGLARFLATGAVDPTFTPAAITGGINAAVVQPDGKIVIGGTFRTVGGINRNYIARLNADGSLDTTFDPQTGFNAQVNALVLQPNGQIVAGGNFSNYNGYNRLEIVRINANGTLDLNFGLLNNGFDGAVSTLALQSDGKIVAGGFFTGYIGTITGSVARLSGTDGSLDTTFTTNSGTGVSGAVNAVAVDAAGRILVGGQFTTFNGNTHSNLVRLTATGALDPTFLPTNAGPAGAVNSIVLESSGQVLIGGQFNTYGSTSQVFIARVNATDGTLDPGYATTQGLGAAPSTIAVMTDGKVVASGYFSQANGLTHQGIAKYSTAGVLDAGVTVALRQPGSVYALAPLANGQWIAGGSFSYVNDVAVNNLARLNANSTPDPGFSANGFPGSVSALAVQPDGKIVVGGGFFSYYNVSSKTSTTSPNIGRLNADGSLDTGFTIGNGFNGNVTALVLQTDGKIVAAGNFTTYATTTTGVTRIARLGTDGLIDSSYVTGTGFLNAPSTLCLQPDGKILAGGFFTVFNGVYNSNIARLNTDGSLDSASFTSNAGFNNSVNTFALRSDGRIMVGGYFNTYAGVNRGDITSLSANGTLDTTFAPPGNNAFNGGVNAITLQDDGKTVVFGSFTTYSSAARAAFARINADGTLDTSFNVPTFQPGLFPPTPAQVLYASDGSLLVTGNRFDFTEGTFSGLVVLEAAPVPTVTTQPVSQSVAGGATVAFSVTAGGQNDTYQWYKDGAAISATTNASALTATLTLTGVTAADAGSYTVVITNLYGTVTSSAAVLSGSSPAPTITTQPVSSNWTLGQNGTLAVAATGSGSLTYQWRKYGQPIAGATAATLTVTNVALADAGLYDVVVANGLTTLASGAAQVNPVPASYPSVFRPRASFSPRVETSGNASSIIPIAAGGFYALGNFTRIDGTAYNGVARFLASGALDSTFITPIAAGTVLTGAVQADGKLVLGGSFRSIGGVMRNFIARLNLDGTLDPAFSSGTGFNANVNALAIQSDGKIVVGGGFSIYNGTTRLDIARLNTDGTLDPAFGTTTGLNGVVSALAIQTNGRIVIGGSFTTFNGTTAAARLARLNTDGTLDAAFSTASGAGANNLVSALALDSSGKILIGGSFSTYASTGRSNFARVNSDGSLDTAFLPGNAGPNAAVTAIALDASGKIVVGGTFSSYASSSHLYLVRVSAADGTADPAFSASQGFSNNITSLAVLADGKIAIGGLFVTIGGTAHGGIARLATDGTLDAGVTSGLRTPGTVTAVLPLAGGQWLIGGNFLYVNDVAATNLARLNATGSTDTTYAAALGTGFNAQVNALALQPDGKVYVGGNFSTLNGVFNRNDLVRLNADGTYDSTFATGIGFNGSVNALTLQANGKILAGGNFVSFNGITTGVFRIARLNTDGTLDSGLVTSGVGFTNTVNTLRVQPDGKILVGGAFTSYNSVVTGDFTRINADGTADTSFQGGTGPVNTVYTVVPRIDGHILVGGIFSTYNGITRSDCVLLNANGSLDNTYAPTAQYNNAVYGVLPQSDGKIVTIGNYTSFGGSTRLFFNRANANGTLDTTFSVPTALPGLAIPATAQITYLADGSLLASGNRFDFSEGVSSGLVLLEAAPVPVITAAPTAQSADPTSKATFSVTATGENVTYQWLKNGVAIPGATTSTLTVNSITVADYTNYSVTVANLYASFTSTPVLLAPITPLILDQPFAQRAVAGGKVIFHVSAVGSGALTYQWTKGGAAISGATGADLTLTHLSATDAASYAVTVFSTSPTASVNSAAALLTVLQADPLFWQQATSDTTDLSPGRMVHDGKGGVYLPWNVQFTDLDMVGGKFGGQLVRLHESDGSYDPGFKLDRRYHLVTHVAIQPDGMLILAVDTGDASTVIRVDSTGAVDPTFTAPLFNYGIRFVTLQRDGRVLVAATNNANPNAPASAITVSNPTLFRLNANGSYDSTFSSVTLSSGSVAFWPPAIDPNDTQGRIYLAGSFNNVNGSPILGLARISSTGVLDTAYGSNTSYPAGYIFSAIRSIAFQSDGRVVAVGQNVRYTARGTLADPIAAFRLNTDGTFDTTFTQPLRSSTGIATGVGVAIRAVIMQSDNRFYGVSDRLVRFNADGSVDATFVPHLMTPETFWVTQGSDGRFYIPAVSTIIGQGGSPISVASNGVVALSAAGVPDFSFQTGGWGRTFYPTANNILSDGRVLVAGNFNHFGSSSAPGVALFDASGNFAASQPALGSASFPVPSQIFADAASAGSDQTYVIWGDYNSGAAQLVRLNSAGQPDTTYSPQVPSTISLNSASPVAAPGGKLLLVSNISPQLALAGTTTGALVRLNADGTVDSGFTPTLTNLARVDRIATSNAVSLITTGSMRILQVLADGRILILINDTSGNIQLERLLANGAVDSSFNPPPLGSVAASTGVTNVITDPLTGTTSQFNTTSYGSSDTITSAVQSPTGQIYIGGRFTTDGVPSGLGRLNADGSIDSSFAGSGIAYAANPAAGAYVASLAADSTGRIYVGGRLDSWNGSSAASGLFRLRADGSYDNTWSPAVSVMDYSKVYLSLQLVGNNLYVFGTVGAPSDAYPGNYKVIALDAPPPVTLASSPLSQTILSGGSIALSVTAVSVENVSYQWRLNGTNIAGATSATYTVASATSANVGVYDVVLSVTSSATTVTSAPASVVIAGADATYIADPSFTRPQLRQAVSPLRITLAPDGKFYTTWVYGGSLTGAKDQSLGVVVRLNADGTPDNTFRSGAVLADALAIAVQPDGKVLVGGVAAAEGNVNGSAVYRVFRLNADGTLDASYQSPAFSNLPRFMTLQPDGKLLAVPLYDGNQSGGNGLNTLTRLNTDGTLDSSFQRPSFDNSNNVFTPLVLDSAGRIYIGGPFSTVNGVARLGLARLLPTGALDSTFVPSGYASVGLVRSVVLQTQGANAGKVLVAGSLNVAGEDYGRYVMRFTSTGAADSTFPVINGAGTDTFSPRLLTLAADDSFTTVGSGLMRYSANGVADSTFVPPTFTSAIPTVPPLFLWLVSQPDGKQIIPVDIGTKISVNGTLAGPFVRFNTNGSVDPTFTPPALQSEVYPGDTISVGPDSRATIIGAFDTVNGTARPAVARFNTDGTLDPLTLTGTAGLVGADGGYVRPDGKIIIGARIGATVLDGSEAIQLYGTDGKLDAGFVLDATAATIIGGDSNVLVAPNSGLLVTSAYAQQIYNGAAYFHRLNPDGSVDASFAPAANNYGAVYRDNTGTPTGIVEGLFKPLAIYPDGRILVASSPGTAGTDATTVYPSGMTSVGITLRRFKADGSLDQSFVAPTLSASLNETTFTIAPGSYTIEVDGLQVDDSPYSKVVIQPDGKILVGGNFTSIGGVNTCQIARLNADGSVDPTFVIAQPATINRSAGDTGLRNLAVAPDGKYWVTGVFDTFNGAVAHGIARLNTDGTVDSTFATDVAFRPFLLVQDNNDVKPAVVFGADGSVYLTGGYAKGADVFPYALTRLIKASAAATAPTIVRQPVPAVTVDLGKSVTFAINATGNPLPTYQWYHNGVLIPNATGVAYVIASLAATDAGSYTVQITNSQGTVTSDASVLTVNPPPVITAQPASTAVTAGQNATFTVTATGTAVTYQWKKGATVLANATSATLVLPSVSIDAAGSYTVDVSNSAGTVTSSAAVLTVNTTPVFNTSPTGQMVSVGANVTFTASAGGTPAPTYQWRKNGVAITGATSATFTITNAQLSDAGEYTVVITNAVTSVTSSGALLVFNIAPTISTQPVSQTVIAGSNVTFTAAASGNPAPTYQWQKNGVNLKGATDASLVLSQVNLDAAAVYSVIATNLAGSATSGFATLTVNPVPVAPGITKPPASQTVTAGTAVAFTVTATGTAPLSYQWQKNAVDITGATNASLTLANPVVADSGNYTVKVTNSVSSVTSDVAALTVNALLIKPSIVSPPINQTVTAGNSAVFIVTADGSGPLTYQWRLNGTAIAGATSSVYSIPNAQAANAGPYTVVITNAVDSVTSTAVTLTVNAVVTAPTITVPPVGQTVTAGTPVTFTVTAAGTAPLTYLWQRNGTAIANASAASFTLASPQVADSGSYNVVVSNSAGFAISATASLTVNPAGTPPALTTVPASQTVTAGASVTFTAAATGTAPLSFQWRKNGVALSGATAATYTIATTATTDTGSYTVKVTNSVGDVSSAPASLTVNPLVFAPAISGASTAATPIGSPYSYQIMASNGATAYTAQNLPTGLTLDTTTGIISGTPTVSGTFVIVLGASNTGGVGVATLTLTVVAPAPVINSATTPSGTVRAKGTFGYQITATNSPTSFTATGLPDGLTLNASSGSIIGSPTVSGTFTVTLTATNTSGTSPAFTLTLNIAAAASVPVVTSDPVAGSQAGALFTYVITASNSPTSYSATGIPDGVQLNAGTGVIKGTPTTAGVSTMNVTATNADGTSAPLAVLVTISQRDTAPVISSSTTDSTTVQATYSYQITATNTPTSFAATGLPAGLAVNTTTGVISGTPTTAGTSAVLISAANVGGTGTAALLLTVQPGLSAPVITSSASKDGTVGDGTFSYAIIASNTPTSFAATGLPDGLTLDSSTGVISGSPRTAGVSTATLTASNAAGAGAAFALKITIKAAASAPSITSDATTTQTQGPGAFFSYQITATNGPLTGYSAAGLPSGLNLDALSGVISGAPAAGTYAVVITASNIGGTSAPLALLITIKAGAQAPSITSSLTASVVQRGTFSYLVTASNMPDISPLPAGNGYTATGLPAGLALNPANGIISGSTALTGSFNVVLTATNDAGTSDAKTLVITVTAPADAPKITSGDTDSVVAGSAYGYQITASGSPTSFDATDRPAWLSVDTHSGIILGTPTVPGGYTTKLTATNTAGTSTALLLTITVTPAPGTPTVTSSLTADGIATGAFSYQIGAGPGPITGYLVTGALPDGLGLDSTTGIISGTPTIPGTYSIPISAVNAKGTGGAKLVVFTIAAAPGSPIVDDGSGSSGTTRRVTGTRQAAAAVGFTASGTVNVPFVYQIVANNSPSGYLASNLPAGLALNPVTGLISGTPGIAGTFIAQIGATNAVGVGATTGLTITIAPPPSAPAVSSSLTASGTAGTAFSYPITASNTPTSFNAVGVPTGLTLSSTTGVLSGTPTVPGVYHVTISANNNVGSGATADLVITIAASASAPAISSAATAAGTVSAVFSYPITASNSPTLYGASGLPPGITLNTATGVIAGTPVVAGQYSATLTATNATGASAPFSLVVTIAPSAAAPVINSASTASVVAGSSFTYVISATNSPVTYNISTLPAGLTANSSGGLITGIPTVPGTYAVTLSANNLTGTGAAFVLALTVSPNNGTSNPTVPVGAHLVNLSTRANVGTGDNVLIVGFVITGPDPKPVMIRGVGGAAITAQGVTAPTLPDPVLDLYHSGNVIGHNDNWATAASDPADIAALATHVGAFALTNGSADSVIYVTLQPGVYSAILYGSGAVNTGVGLVEIYDTQDNLSTTTPRLVNISSRGQVGTGDNVMIAGFVVTGDQPKQILIRGVGPTLTTMNVPSNLVLSDPAIYLYHNGVVIAQNDNWGSAGDGATLSAAASATGAFPLPSGSTDAAMLVTLQPGLYSVIVAGTGGTTGIALVELYELP